MLSNSLKNEDLPNCCYLCNECPNTFSTLNQLQTHLIIKHKPTTVFNTFTISSNEKNEKDNFINYNEEHNNSKNTLKNNNSLCKTESKKQSFNLKIPNKFNLLKVNHYYY